MMISLMESVANNLIQPLLPAGFVTVGYEVSVKHKSPALSGTKGTAKSERLEADGRKLLFEMCVMQED
jgi:predicted thioesterase